jgi:DNA-binding transcriptional LysR family regulator
MDIDRIRYFLAFCETGSLVKASEILRISQPALSKAFRLLEEELGLKLLEQEGRGLKLTESGQAFRKEVSPILNQLLSIPKKIQGTSNQLPTRIGTFEVFSTYFLSRLMEFINIEALEVYEFIPGQLEEALTGNLIDIGITYIPIPKSGVDFTEITKIKMGIFGLKQFQNSNYETLPFVIPLSPLAGTPSKVVGLDGWPDHKFKRKIKFRVTLMESAIELCRKGHAVAYLPEFIVNLHNENVKAEYKLLELQSPLSQKERMQSVFTVKRKESTESKIERNIAKAIRSLK